MITKSSNCAVCLIVCLRAAATLVSVKKARRADAVLNELSRTGRVLVADISKHLDVSPATIRRDLQDLERQNLLRRVHGGAVPQNPSAEVPLPYKGVRRQPEKLRIAKAAVNLLGEASIVGFTGGTTTAAVARLIGDRPGFTMVTTGLNIASELVDSPRLRVIIAGGEVRGVSLEVVGPIARQTLSQFQVDIAFIGVDGLSPTGCTGYDQLGSEADATMIENARRVIVVADSSKLGRIASSTICSIDQVDVLITDSEATGSDLEQIRAKGVDVRLA